MSALFRIVYAAHANGTHHKLALDGLRAMTRSDAEAWTKVFLKHVEKFLEGSKAPDNSFKDFKNHVLHVGEKYWGGAPDKVEEWYGKTVAALQARDWELAAYSAGVLSHYYTDPAMPFHTGQTEAENSMHRAVEWSINRSYDGLRKRGLELYPALTVPTHSGPKWLRETTCDAAEFSHRYYEKLIAHYNLTRGVVRPEEGLDPVARNFVAELLIYAATGFGQLMDRAITEAGGAAPPISLTAKTFLATLKIPSKWLEKKLSNDADKFLVQAMYDELKATGKVDRTLPEDDRIVRDLHAKEVLAPKLAKRAATRQTQIAAAPAPQLQMRPVDPVLDTAIAKFSGALSGSPPATATTAQPPAIPDIKLSNRSAKPAVPSVSSIPFIRREAEVVAEPQHLAPPPSLLPQPVSLAVAREARGDRAEHAEQQKSYLALSDDLEAAPSIGPKMAETLANLGIKTVSDFLGHDPYDMAELLDDGRFDGETLADWQDQAKLVIDVPGLRGGGAQLLVGAGYRTCAALADADPVALSADVLTFATSADGKRMLRDGTPPDLEKIKSWVDAAQAALAA